MTVVVDGPLFASAQNALTFALNFEHQQSPSNPMQQLMKRTMMGKGLGLSGIDGAHQAGAILQLLEKLPVNQRAILTVRFGDVKASCPCCGQDANTRAWREAVDVLSHAKEIADLHQRIRHAIVEKIVCKRRMMRVAALASRYESTERTIQRRMRDVKPGLVELEARATAEMQDWLAGRGVVA